MKKSGMIIDPDTAKGVTAEHGSSLARFERAALILFVSHSIDSTTTKQIAAAAGLSEGLLYRYAPSKIGLAENMFFSIHARLGHLVRAAGKTGDTIEEKARAIVDAYVHCADDDWELFSYHLLTAHRFLGQDKATQNPVDAVEKIISDAMKANQIPKGDTAFITAIALGAVLQPAFHKAYGRLNGNLVSYAPQMTRAVLAILQQI